MSSSNKQQDKAVKIVLKFHSVVQRNRAVSVLSNHGFTTTTDPITPIMVFKNLTKPQAIKIHQLLVTMGIDYSANIHGIPKQKAVPHAQTDWDGAALPSNAFRSITGTRI